jgi:hypothetical protein
VENNNDNKTCWEWVLRRLWFCARAIDFRIGTLQDWNVRLFHPALQEIAVADPIPLEMVAAGSAVVATSPTEYYHTHSVEHFVVSLRHSSMRYELRAAYCANVNTMYVTDFRVFRFDARGQVETLFDLQNFIQQLGNG